MNTIRVKLKEIQRFSYIIKSPFYSSVVINNFEIKTNEKLLITKKIVVVCKRGTGNERFLGTLLQR
ncbi:hypothetical protein [Plasmodium yoelii yoelii]|uniref:Uncharacterized protein n=1 Tax=Plasmodium yoelii yoelii TaxID=73239 RepID=Q7R8C1_PLAYO|nr:hypothetical protein [Plasmodium yoelii yoelii]